MVFAAEINATDLPKEGSKEVVDTVKRGSLNSVVVTASKSKINRNNVPLNISMIGREEIETSGNSSVLPVLSKLVPGLFVTQKGVTGFGVSDGAAGTINIRGVGQGNKVLMLLDGQPQWAGIFGHSIPDLYTSSDVERVEVIKGPGSLLYGSNAMGGVINVITREQEKEGFNGRAMLSYGSYNTGKFLINSGFKKNRLSAFLSLNHDMTDGHRENSRFSMTNGFAKVGYNLGKHFDITSDIAVAGFYNQNPGKVTTPLNESEMDIFRLSASLSLENQHKYGTGAIKGFFNQGRHEINEGYSPGSLPRTYLFNSVDHNYGLMVYENLRFFEGNMITIGFDHKNWGGEAWNKDRETSGKTYLTDKTIDETAAYLVLQHDFFDKLTINGGLRFEYNSAFGDVWIPQLGASLRPFEGNVIKALISKGYRSPTIREMFMFPPQNADLLPESMINFEFSIGQSFLDSDLVTELNLFFIDGWNMIEQGRINGIPKNLNTGYFDNRGVELQVSYRIKPELRTDVNYSYLKTSKPILAAPEHKLFVGAIYSHDRITFNADMQYVGGMYTNTSTGSREYFTLLNARIAYRLDVLGGKTRLFVNGDNITGTAYTINEGFPMPGATFLAGIDINF